MFFGSLVFLQAQMLLLFNICVHQSAFSENALYLYILVLLFTVLGPHTVSYVPLQSPTFLWIPALWHSVSVCSVMSDSLHHMDCGLPGSSVHGIISARIVEWTAISFSGDLSDPGIEPVPLVSSALAGEFFTTEPPGKPFFWTVSTNTQNYILLFFRS